MSHMAFQLWKTQMDKFSFHIFLQEHPIHALHEREGRNMSKINPITWVQNKAIAEVSERNAMVDQSYSFLL